MCSSRTAVRGAPVKREPWERTGHGQTLFIHAYRKHQGFLSLVLRSCLATMKAQGLLLIKSGWCNGCWGDGVRSRLQTPQPRRPGLLAGDAAQGFAPGTWFWVHKQGCSGVSLTTVTPSHRSHGLRPAAVPALTPPRPPRSLPRSLRSARRPPQPRKAANSGSAAPAKGAAAPRAAHGAFPPPRPWLATLHSPATLAPGCLSLPRWPWGPCLPPMLSSSSSSSAHGCAFGACCKKH